MEAVEMAQVSEMKRLLPLGVFLQKILPRGKGAVVRVLGRALISDDSRFLVTRHGAKLMISPDSLDVYCTMHGAGNAWDYDDFLVCHSGIPNGGVFYDVGANVGYYVIEMLAVTQQKIKAIGFEPNHRLAKAIKSSLALNGMEGTVIEAMVGESSGEGDFYVAAASIHSSAVPDSGRDIQSVRRVPVVTIDDLVGRGEIPPPDFIKMDIEGSEHLALRGAEDTLRRSKPHLYLEYLIEADPGERILSEVKRLSSDANCYDLYLSPRSPRRKDYSSRLYAASTNASLENADAIFLRNRHRPVRSETIFG